MKKINTNTKDRRVKRIRAKVFGHTSRPRLSVFRSNKFIYAQIIDDDKKITLVSATSAEVKGEKNKTIQAEKVGKLLAEKAKDKKIVKVVFDRGLYKYHGRVKSLAEGARSTGLEF